MSGSGLWKRRLRLVGALAAVLLASLGGATAHALPPGWAYELVTPADTLGMNVGESVPSADGNHVFTGTVLPAFPGQSTGNFSVVAEVRTASGWLVTDLAAGDRDNQGFNGLWFSDDASHALLISCDFSLIGCPSAVGLQLVGLDGTRRSLLTIGHSSFAQQLPQFPGAAADLSTTILAEDETLPPLLPAEDTHTQGRGLYAIHDDGTLEFLGVDANGVALPCGASLAGADDPSSPGTGFEQGGMSADGGTVAFMSPDPLAGCPDPVDIYVRRGGVSTDISAPGPTNSNPDLGASYAGNTRDGSTIFFTTATQLDPDDTDTVNDLYSYEVASGALTRLTPGADVAEVAVAPNGQYIYFTALNPIAGHGDPGAKNLFVWHDDQIDFIATLHGANGLGQPIGRNGNTAVITPDGTHIVFTSNDPDLTHQSTTFLQMLRFSADDGRLDCISCPPDGSSPTADVAFPFVSRALTTRFQSDDGSTVVFQTSMRLDSRDTNGLRDVYMWRNGRISIVSDGRGTATPSSKAIGMSADGNTIFFSSFDRLVPEAAQDNLKVYAARLGGGFPTPTPVPPCSADACRPLPTPPPPAPPIASMHRDGPGNSVGKIPRVQPRVTVVKLGAAAKRRLLRTGSVTLAVRTTQAGKLRLVLRTRIAGRWRVAQAATRASAHAGTVHVALRLTPLLRRQLGSHGTLRLRITATNLKTGAIGRSTVTLGASER